MAIFAGGLVQLLAGMWEFPRGNVFGATGEWPLRLHFHFTSFDSFYMTYETLIPYILAFSSYGAFWMSYATILIPSSGIIDAYSKSPPEELSNALGIYLITWGMFTCLMLCVYKNSNYSILNHIPFSRIAVLKKNVSFILLFAFLTATFVVLAIAEFSLKVCT